MRVEVDSCTVELTEQTVHELQAAIDEAKKTIKFTNDPIPDGDMSPEQFRDEQAKRGTIRVESPWLKKLSFAIEIVPPQDQDTQEAAGYRLVKPPSEE